MFLLTIIHFLILAFLTLYFYACCYYKDDPFVFRAGETILKVAIWGLLSGEAIFLIQGCLHLFDIIDFGMYFHYVFVLPYLILGVSWLTYFFVLWIVRYQRKKQMARTTPDYQAIHTALEAGHMSEVIRLYKAVNCLNETYIYEAMQKVLKNVSVENAIRNAIQELLALQRDSAGALRAGAPPEFVNSLEEKCENMLNKMWLITDRVVAVRRQKIESPKIQKAVGIQYQRIRNLTNGVHSAREKLALLTLHGWNSEDIEKALLELSGFLAGYETQLDASDWSAFSGEGREDAS